MTEATDGDCKEYRELYSLRKYIDPPYVVDVLMFEVGIDCALLLKERYLYIELYIFYVFYEKNCLIKVISDN